MPAPDVQLVRTTAREADRSRPRGSVKGPDLANAINLAMLRFEHYRALRKESVDLKQALEDRKVIERAKGIVERRLWVDEQEAFVRMRRLASHANAKLVELARKVLEADAVFTELEKI